MSLNVTKLPTTLQGFFDNAWQWAVVEQHPRCVCDGSGHVCVYRGSDFNRCVIGASIPDADYHRSMEGKPVDQLLTEHFAGAGVELWCIQPLRELQRIHDYYFAHDTAEEYLKYIRVELTRFANLHELTIPETA